MTAKKETKKEETAEAGMAAAMSAATVPADVKPTVVPEKPKAEEQVTISKDALDKVMSRIEAQDREIADRKEKDMKRDREIEALKAISDKALLARYESQREGPVVPRARVSFWDGRPILAWSKGKDEVGFRDGSLEVTQTINVYLEDGDGKEPVKKELEYLYWAQNARSESGDVTEKFEKDGRTYWTVALESGRKVTVDIRFINAF